MAKERIVHVINKMAALLHNSREEQRSGRGEYKFLLGGMDAEKSTLARSMIAELGIDHLSPEGDLAFKDPEARLQTILHLHSTAPTKYGWMWREITDRRPRGMSSGEWLEWVQNYPIKREFLVGTSKDPNKSAGK